MWFMRIARARVVGDHTDVRLSAHGAAVQHRSGQAAAHRTHQASAHHSQGVAWAFKTRDRGSETDHRDQSQRVGAQ